MIKLVSINFDLIRVECTSITKACFGILKFALKGYMETWELFKGIHGTGYSFKGAGYFCQSANLRVHDPNLLCSILLTDNAVPEQYVRNVRKTGGHGNCMENKTSKIVISICGDTGIHFFRETRDRICKHPDF